MASPPLRPLAPRVPCYADPVEPKAAKVTTAIDAALLRRARIKALEEGTSLNAVLRERVEEYVSNASPANAAKRTFLRLAAASKAQGGRKVSREEMHERG
jgi:hypothetical protein